MKNRALRSGQHSCLVAVSTDTSDPALPVAGTGRLSQVRNSRRAPWRAAVLILIHLAIAAHITHYVVAGRTLSPVEPSESMYTLELGYVNAGFIFFAVVLLGTLVFGRFFCGWACHIVALQDFCGWLMKKLGVRPRPFRSRLLAFAPLAVALYMFLWPSLKRLVLDSPPAFPGFSNHLLTSGFWETFPGPVFAMLTFLTCGFAAVYFMGAKGFCTYGCPYGALFGALDRLAPGRIRVTADCEQCGHCTATCTSNVLVHEEVRRYGMVVDPGCMKCMDCVNVCPKGALYYGFGKPSLFKGPRAAEPGIKRYALRFREELGLGVLCLVGTLSFRGLYDGPPLLMSIGLGGLTAFIGLKLWQLARDPNVRLQNLNLKLGRRLSRTGGAFACVGVLWLLFTAHSTFVQWHRAWGSYHLNRTQATRSDVLSGKYPGQRYPESHYQAAERARAHFAAAERWGLAGVAEVKLGLAWMDLLANHFDRAALRLREALALAPERTQLHQDLVEVLMASGQLPEAAAALRAKIAALEPTAADHFQLAGLLAESGELEPAREQFQRCLDLAPSSAEARYNLGGVLRRLGRPKEAVEQLRIANRLAPDDMPTLVELGLALAASGERDEALELLRRAAALAPAPEQASELQRLIGEIES